MCKQTYLLRTCIWIKRQRIGRGKMDWFKTGKEVHQDCILSLCLFNFYAEYIMQNARLDELQAGVKIAGRNINNIRYAENTTQKVKKNYRVSYASERGE